MICGHVCYEQTSVKIDVVSVHILKKRNVGCICILRLDLTSDRQLTQVSGVSQREVGQDRHQESCW